MTENPKSEPFAGMLTSSSTPAPSTPGQLLRAARLQAGVHLAVLSVTLKVPVKQLEAMEADQLDPAKGAVFYRGLTSAICRHLHVDPAPMLALLPVVPDHLQPHRAVGEVDASVKPKGTWRSSSGKPRQPVFAVALAMLVLIAAFLWLPSPSQWSWFEELQTGWNFVRDANDEGRRDAVNSTPPEAQGAPFPSPASVVETSASSPQVFADPGAVAPSALVASASSSVAVASSAGTTVIPKDTNQSGAKTRNAEWVFSASADSWLELRTGPYTIVWSGLLKAGQSQSIQSPLPVSVVVGRAQGVTVTLRGQPFDLKPHTQVTVARFVVKE